MFCKKVDAKMRVIHCKQMWTITDGEIFINQIKLKIVKGGNEVCDIQNDKVQYWV